MYLLQNLNIFEDFSYNPTSLKLVDVSITKMSKHPRFPIKSTWSDDIYTTKTQFLFGYPIKPIWLQTELSFYYQNVNIPKNSQ